MIHAGITKGLVLPVPSGCNASAIRAENWPLPRAREARWIKTLLLPLFLCLLAVPTASANAISQSTLTLAFASNRNVQAKQDPGSRLGEQRGPLVAGVCETRSTRLKLLENANRSSPIALLEGFTQVTEVTIEPLDVMLTRVGTTTHGTRPALYIHGYNENFSKACKRASLLADALDKTSSLILFTWPSDGNPANYTRDEADISYSEKALEQIIVAMADAFGYAEFDVIAHSLGSRALMRVSALLGRGHKRAPVVNQLLFVASDVDADAFRHHLPDLTRAARTIRVVANNRDLPLGLSEELHGAPRLGQTGIHLKTMAGVDVYDLSGVAMRGPSGHLYHLNNPSVQAQLREWLSE